ncbi:EamA family transporter [Candidatus Woesearchaeota archaeon]|nr:EamA family transporter [Candidatus Woesearchaeota archaeon]
MGTELWAVGLVVLAVVVGSFGPIFLKKSSKTFSLNPFKMIKNYNLIFGVSFYAFGTICFIPALKGGDLSLLYPLVSLGYVFVAFYSRWMLKERINFYKWTGILAILIGVSLIGIGS